MDIIAHSMGGLMARGFVQQPDYKGKGNYMNGSIHSTCAKSIESQSSKDRAIIC